VEWTAYASKETDPARNLALEDALLEALPKGSAAFLVYRDAPCVVIGRNQNPWVEAAPYTELPIFRRRSGGGAVYHDSGNLNWSFLAPRDSWNLENALDFVRAALQPLGVSLERDARGALYLAGNKVSGSARRFFRSSVLIHGTLLVSSDLTALGSALIGLRLMENRSIVSVPHPVGNLEDAVPGVTVDAVRDAFFRALTSRFGAGEPLDPYRTIEDGLLAEREQEHRSWTWVYGRTMPFCVSLYGRAGDPSFLVREGRVVEIQGEVDGELMTILAPFLGRPFDIELLRFARETAERIVFRDPPIRGCPFPV
jgi:lipoate---protein ligase